MMPGDETATRDSAHSASSGSASGRPSSRRQNPQQQLSQIEKSVTHLLVATKQLLETLTEWSRGEASENNVSDVYVRLGYEFNIACRAFTAIGIETADLGPVPDLLRGILEETLSQEASKESLDRFLPRIRDIIINLLHGLKKKQQKLRPRNARDNGVGVAAAPPRQSSVASSSSGEVQPPGFQEDRSSISQQQTRPPTNADDLLGPALPPRTTSAATGRDSPSRRDTSGSNRSLNRGTSASRGTMGSDSSISSEIAQNMPVIAPYPQEDTIPTNGLSANGSSIISQQPPAYSENFQHPPPPPPPKQQDALAALQRGGELERRASRRFSAYQIQKHLGTPAGGMPVLPTQNGPIPNRGKDVRESMNAVRTRGSVLPTQTRLVQGGNEASPARQNTVARRISEETNTSLDQARIKPPPEPQPEDSPINKTPEDKLGPAVQNLERDKSDLSATVNGPVLDYEVSDAPIMDRKIPLKRAKASTRAQRDSDVLPDSPPQKEFIPEDSPQPGKELTLFLQYKSKIKKYVLADGSNDLTIGRLQLAFIEKFNWNTHSNGMDLPEIYIQDQVSGVRHELEDLSDVKDRSVLVLNIEALDEVKRHIDDGIGGLRTVVEGVRNALADQQSAIQRVSDRQQEAAKEIASIAAAPSLSSARNSTLQLSKPGALKPQPLSPTARASSLEEVQSLRRDLAVVRQTYSSFVSDINTSMSSLKSKASSVKSVAIKARIPSLDITTGRPYVEIGKKTLDTTSSALVTRVDDLQDIVEDLRKDVVMRGVRPRPRQLETVSRDISSVTAELKKLKEFLRREKPVWSKVWEKELETVCDDRELLSMQVDLATDLEDDLDKAAETFALVEEATRQQNAQLQQLPNGTQATLRSASGKMNALALDQGVDPAKAKDGVLGEVRALQPNHESRIEAIERAEKARERELESRRGGEFQAELGNFVEEGKLKKTGGVEEAERLRKAKDEKSRREVWERMNGPLPEPPAEEKEGGDGVEKKTEEGLDVPPTENLAASSSSESEFVEAKEETVSAAG
ncbi:MAG: Bud site selection protein 6 [Bogoriella megaspora]|nr:MAG: Bud site selection protein 6 [Bogoriella megaspora]